MSTEPSIAVPTQVDLLEFFGTEPEQEAPQDGFWSYMVTDASGTVLRLSFDLLERSIQTVLQRGEQELASVSHEGLTSLRISGRGKGAVLKAVARTKDTQTSLEIRLHPNVAMRWATLVGTS